MNPPELLSNFILPGSELFYATRYVDQDVAEKHLIVRLFDQLWKDILLRVREKHIAQTKIQWWQEEIKACYHTTPSHPLTQLLYKYRQNFDEMSWIAILNYLNACLEPFALTTASDLEHHLHELGLIREILLLRCFKTVEVDSITYAKFMAKGFELGQLLTHVSKEFFHQRFWIPSELFERNKIDLKKFLTAIENKALDSSCLKTLTELFQQSIFYLEQGIVLCPETQRPFQIPTLLLARFQIKLYKKYLKNPHLVLEKPQTLMPFQKFWIAWKYHSPNRASLLQQTHFT